MLSATVVLFISAVQCTEKKGERIGTQNRTAFSDGMFTITCSSQVNLGTGTRGRWVHELTISQSLLQTWMWIGKNVLQPFGETVNVWPQGVERIAYDLKYSVAVARSFKTAHGTVERHLTVLCPANSGHALMRVLSRGFVWDTAHVRPNWLSLLDTFYICICLHDHESLTGKVL